MEQKKETKAQLERRIKNALVFVPRDKDYKMVFFSDKGLKIEVTSEYCVISTMYHRHVFDKWNTATMLSRPYLYTQRLVEISLENDCRTQDGYSYAKLIEVLKEKENKEEYNIVTYVDWWLFNCFQPLYSIGESEIESFLVYESYVHNIARQSILLSEKTEDVTNKQFFAKMNETIKQFVDNIDEIIIFHKKTDEEVAKENIIAAQQQEFDDVLKEESKEQDI